MNTLKTAFATALITVASGVAFAQTPAPTAAPAATPAPAAKATPAPAAAPAMTATPAAAATPAAPASGAKHGHKRGGHKHGDAAKTETKTQ